MRDFIVYTAGPIKGLTFLEATEWRDYAAKKLAPHNIRCASPLRDQDYHNEIAIADAYQNSMFCSSRAVMTRDFFDCTTADMLLINLLHAKEVSIGTCFEISWAFQARIPIVIVMEKGNVHEHAMIKEAAGWIVSALDDALLVVKHVLVPEGTQSPNTILRENEAF